MSLQHRPVFWLIGVAGLLPLRLSGYLDLCLFLGLPGVLDPGMCLCFCQIHPWARAVRTTRKRGRRRCQGAHLPAAGAYCRRGFSLPPGQWWPAVPRYAPSRLWANLALPVPQLVLDVPCHAGELLLPFQSLLRRAPQIQRGFSRTHALLHHLGTPLMWGMPVFHSAGIPGLSHTCGPLVPSPGITAHSLDAGFIASS